MDTTQDFTLTSYFRTMQQHKAVFLMLLAAVAVVSFFSTDVRRRIVHQPIVFKSRFTLLITPPPEKRYEKDGQKSELESWFASEELLKQLILSEDVLSRTLKAAGVEQDWRAFRSHIAFLPVSNDKARDDKSFLITPEVTSSSGEDAKALATALSNEIVLYIQDMAAREKVAKRKQLELMAVERKASIEKAQENLLAWRKANDVWDMGQLTDAHSEEIQRLEKQKGELAKQLARLDADLRAIEENTARGFAPADAGPEERRELDNLLVRRAETQKKLSEARKVFTDSSSKVQELQAELGSLEQSISKIAQSLSQVARSKVLGERSRYLSEIAAVDSKLHRLKQDKELAKAQVQLQKLEYEITISQKNYSEILSKIDEIKVEEQAKRNEASFTLVESASEGTRQGGVSGGGLDTKKALSLLAFSLVVSVAGTIAFGTLSSTYSLRKQVEILGVPVLGVIPKVGKEFDHSAFDNHPNSTMAAQFRKLIVNLVRSDSKVNRIVVTSCWPSEGKSFVSANLAAALTRFELTVSLIDADLRKPFLTSFFQKSQDMGLRQVLQGECPLEELIQPTRIANLQFLPAGRGAQDPSELFHRGLVIERLAERDNSFVVIDTAPLSVCSDAIQLSDKVDGVVLVVSSKFWTGRAELEYLLDLEERGIKVLGLVLNGVRESELTYNHYYKQAYGSYYAKSNTENRV